MKQQGWYACMLFHKCCCMIQTENIPETDTLMFAGRGRESIETTKTDADTPCKASASFWASILAPEVRKMNAWDCMSTHYIFITSILIDWYVGVQRKQQKQNRQTCGFYKGKKGEGWWSNPRLPALLHRWDKMMIVGVQDSSWGSLVCSSTFEPCTRAYEFIFIRVYICTRSSFIMRTEQNYCKFSVRAINWM